MTGPANRRSGSRPPALVVLVGPTAVGKTETSIALAEMCSAEIVSADSRYLYRGLDIGTAKPSPEERSRAPHHLIDVTTPDQPWSLAQYQAAAYADIEDIQRRGRLPLLVGGTGQYVRAVAEGWQVPAGAPEAGLRLGLERALAEQGLDTLVGRLKAVDPSSAKVVDLRNPRRVVRALEVALATGESFVAQRRRQPLPYPVHWLGLARPRPELYQRIDERVEQMLAAGWVDEVERLVKAGYSWDLPALSAVGYRQIGAYLREECTLEQARQAVKRATRQFVRRQGNWFKPADPAIHWHRAAPGVAADLADFLRRLQLAV